MAESDEEREDREFDAGDLSSANPAEEQAAQDYDDSVGQDDHEQEVAEVREEAGIEEPPSEEP